MESSVQFQAMPSRHFFSYNKYWNCTSTSTSSSSSVLRFSSNKFFTRELKCHNTVNSKHNQLRKNPKEFGEPDGLSSNPSIPCGVTESEERVKIDRRNMVMFIAAGVIWNASTDGLAVAAQFADMPALRGKDYGKTKMRYPDYTETDSGLQYKDLRHGDGPTPKIGDTVVIDWDGYTIGYYGRIFEARNKTKGGSFVGDDKDFYKFRVGSQEVIPAFEEAVKGMALGGIRRIIVPPELGYPENDYSKSGPKPTTFSGQRALDFVLRNQGLIDKTLLFDIELLKIVPK